MAASMATLGCSRAALGGLSSLGLAERRTGLKWGGASVGMRSPFEGRRQLQLVRCDVGDNLGGVKEAVDTATKKDISRDEILRSQEVNESEKRSVFGAKPSSGSFYPRPELERRPETGPRDLGSIFAFDGAVPETVNGRLAMVGFVWAVVAERMSGLTVFDQLYSPEGGLGLVFYLAVVQVITFASLIPIFNGESTDARSFGPFRARAERWNGRLAMLGFLALLLTEQFTHSPVFAPWV